MVETRSWLNLTSQLRRNGSEEARLNVSPTSWASEQVRFKSLPSQTKKSSAGEVCVRLAVRLVKKLGKLLGLKDRKKLGFEKLTKPKRG